MRLPNFYSFDALNELRRRMGIPQEVYGTFSSGTASHRLTADELDRLTSGEGIDVDFDQLVVLPDGTFAYKDSRVLLYIRDVHVHGDRDREPRYHVSHCETLKEMRRRGRFHIRYVIATELNGVFKLNLISDGQRRTEKRRLAVCQNCLAELGFDGFDRQWARVQRKEFVREFTPERFFGVYPRSLHFELPGFAEDTAPINDYTHDFDEIGSRLKRELGWQCEKCRNVLEGGMRQYLHTHHLNGDRSNNNRSNLKVLCIACHADEPRHHHIRRTPQYREFMRQRSMLSEV